MKAPDFWWHPPGIAAKLLAPAALLYAAVADRRIGRPGQRAPCPVICVGNMTVGGTGKTPTALALARLLGEAGSRSVFLTRGYRGRLPGPVVVDPSRHDALDIGDEALLLAAGADTVVSRDRPAGAVLAASLRADLVVMDDGLQNPSLVKDFALAVFDGATGLGNGATLPAGPLRASASAQWPRVDAVLVIGPGRAGDAVVREAERRRVPVHRAQIVPDPGRAEQLRGKRLLAFAGIGRPAKFFDTLAALGADVVVRRAFADHHAYTPAELGSLLDEAAREKLLPVTTEKDAARLGPVVGRDPRIATLPIVVAFADAAALLDQIRSTLERRGRQL